MAKIKGKNNIFINALKWRPTEQREARILSSLKVYQVKILLKIDISPGHSLLIFDVTSL